MIDTYSEGVCARKKDETSTKHPEGGFNKNSLGQDANFNVVFKGTWPNERLLSGGDESLGTDAFLHFLFGESMEEFVSHDRLVVLRVGGFEGENLVATFKLLYHFGHKMSESLAGFEDFSGGFFVCLVVFGMEATCETFQNLQLGFSLFDQNMWILDPVHFFSTTKLGRQKSVSFQPIEDTRCGCAGYLGG